MDCKYHFFMDTISIDSFNDIFNGDSNPLPKLDRYYKESPLLDVVAYNYNPDYLAGNRYPRSIPDYCHVIMVKDSRFKYVDCKIDDEYLDAKKIQSPQYPDIDIYIFKIDKDVKTVTLNCFGHKEEDNISSTIAIIKESELFFDRRLSYKANRNNPRSLISAYPHTVRFIFNPWESERTDVFVFYRKMMIEHKCIHQETNNVTFDKLPLGCVATIIQSSSGKVIVYNSVNMSDIPPYGEVTRY